METIGKKLINLQHVLFWGSFVFITSFISLKAYPWSIALLRVVFVSALNVALYILCYKVLVNQFIEKNKFWQFLFVIISLLIITVALRFNFDKGIAHYRTNTGLQPLQNTLILFGISFFTQAAVILIACLLSIASNRFKTESKLIEASKKHSELELTMLKTKISPHFLLNTLNNIYYYAQHENNKSSEAILKLSYLLQYISYEVSLKRISFEREMEIIYALNDLFAMRFEQTLNIKFDIKTAELSSFEIMPGILVTLFENALKHSGIGIQQNAWIQININKSHHVFTAQISNSKFEEISGNSTFYSGIGLNSIREMLQLEYGNNHNLIVHHSPTIFDVMLTIKDQPIQS
jgi:two-component system LytT family sensor kinase